MWWCGSAIYRVLYSLRRSFTYDGVKKQYIEYCALYVVYFHAIMCEVPFWGFD